ncbi:hypothetical protein A1D23_06605 [Chelonobacter oris]|uniref:restriction endonuclease FokI C-terminal domain-containing protein n=1 Tax=Chelonobacter oris TaxID=505317 RepID=UPI00244AA1A8|nr:restriction endonuclease FokI C-terminal domain-containing protein [Chelonobacter oris]MDH2999762.1 hypothetical protein [Chelonobacter oris]
MNNRTFGWVQNPSSFENLKRLVGIFIQSSEEYEYLTHILNTDSLIKDENIRTRLQKNLSTTPVTLSYLDIVGTGTSNRKEAVCNALGQAIIKPQKLEKLYTDNWTTDGFVRWAECLGLITYIDKTDSFQISERGSKFYHSTNDFSDNNALHEAFMSYPPVHQILSELDKAGEVGLSKYELGAKLGFTGEAGFTSISYSLVVDTLINEADTSYIKKLKSNIEGSADKYARMISGWLTKIGWVSKTKRKFRNKPSSKDIELGHCFKITLKGRQVLSKLNGGSKHAIIPKYVSSNMLATNAQNHDYLRTRRYSILEILSKKNDIHIDDLLLQLNTINLVQGLEITEDKLSLQKDLEGLNNCGIFISLNNDKVKLISKLLPLQPLKQKVIIKNIEIEQLKKKALKQYTFLPPEWVELIEISREKSQSQIFEMKVAELFKKCYRINSIHLGGASKPDCLLWGENFSVIVDTKAYKDGFPFQQSEKDKMVRYLRECERKDSNENPNKWWLNFPDDEGSVRQLYFTYVSSFFSSTAKKHLENVGTASNYNGCAWDVDGLLSGANFFLQHPKTRLEDYLSDIFTNNVVNPDVFNC